MQQVKDLFKGFKIEPFQENFTKDTVSIELVEDIGLDKSESGNYRHRQSNYIAYLRKKIKGNYEDELEKVIDPIFDKMLELGLDLDFVPTFIQEKNEIHILFNISFNYTI